MVYFKVYLPQAVSRAHSEGKQLNGNSAGRVITERSTNVKTDRKGLTGSRLIRLMVILLLLGLPAVTRAESSWQNLQEALRQAEDGSVIILDGDVTASADNSAISIEAGRCVTLDLNGHTLDRSLEQLTAYGYVLKVQEGAILIIRDSGKGEGVITGGYHGTGGGIVNHGTLIMEGGCVTGNTAQDSGGGIANYGTMVLTGGRVSGNTSLGNGGGIYNQAKAHLTIHGNIVSGNSAAEGGEFANDGMLTVVSARPQEVLREDMPVLHAFITQLSVVPAAILLLILLLTVWLDSYIGRKRKRSMIVIISLVLGLMIQNYLEFRLVQIRADNVSRITVSIFGYAVRPVILAMFLSVVKPGGKHWPAWVLTGINAAVYMTAFFTDTAFGFTPDTSAFGPGMFVSGPLYHTCTVVSLLLFIQLTFLSIRQFHPVTQGESWLPVIMGVLIAGAVAMDYTTVVDEQPLSFLTIAIVITCIFFFIWLHLQFVREHEQGLRAEQRIRIMKTQIQPHFLFNTLNTIRALYAVDPGLAESTLEKFSKYLRQNLDSLEQRDLIPFSREMEYTRLYADIEMLRFQNIRMEYRIEDADFDIPPLTIQPLVENAIRHGVRIREEGIVTVSSRREENFHVIEILDNGAGFDTDAKKEPEETHIGIANVKSRVESLCGGTLDVKSEIGKGTRVILRFPAGPAGGKGRRK